MINDVRQTIVNMLGELYPGNSIYADDVPQDFETPSFLISLINQDYEKRLNSKYKSLLSFDVAYFSDKGATEIKTDCQEMQLVLFRAFDLIGSYRVLNKQANTTDNVLHFTFNISYSESRVETGTTMQTQQTNTNI